MHLGQLTDLQSAVHLQAFGILHKFAQPVHILPLFPQQTLFLVQLLLLRRQKLRQPVQILALKQLLELLKGHAHAFEPLDLVDEGKLTVHIVAVAGLRVDIAGLEQSDLVVMPQTLDRHVIQLGRLPDGIQVIHRYFPQHLLNCTKIFADFWS